MINVRKYRGKNVGVLGLGATGISAAENLTRAGARVSAWDDSAQRCHLAITCGFSIVNFIQEGLGHLDCLLVSPGIPMFHPEPHPIVVLAKREGVKIVSDVELLQESCPVANYIGVTGTNGKSTVTALLDHLLRCGGKNSRAGGNIGSPALDLEMLGADGTYVLELSSYQLDLVRNTFFNIAIWTNLSPDHLERHGTLDGYIRAKKNIFMGMGGFAVIGVDDEASQAVFDELVSKNDRVVIPVSAERSVAGGVSVVDGILCDAMNSISESVMDVKGLTQLPGSHNWQNIALAYAAVRLMGLGKDAFVKSVATYTGLPHRMEKVGLHSGVTYVNDSKATNMAAAAKALACYNRIYWIMGGRAKEITVEEVLPMLSSVMHIYTIGESGGKFEKIFRGKVHVKNSGTLAKAFIDATNAAMSDVDIGSVVLLSPGCASFDQFENFEARGLAFKGLFSELRPLQRSERLEGGPG